MQTRILSKEIRFWVSLVTSIGIPEEEMLWQEYGGIASYLNGQLRLLMKNIKEKNVSMANFNISDAVEFGKLLNSPHLDQEVCSKLSHLLYGADERKKFFSELKYQPKLRGFPSPTSKNKNQKITHTTLHLLVRKS